VASRAQVPGAQEQPVPPVWPAQGLHQIFRDLPHLFPAVGPERGAPRCA